jgi:hypothetical protein
MRDPKATLPSSFRRLLEWFMESGYLLVVIAAYVVCCWLLIEAVLNVLNLF